jgi:translation initiation factor IF-3
MHRINERIAALEMRLLDAENKQIGIVSRAEALQKRQETGLDLVEIAAQAQPPVVKLIDYQKFLYQLKKKKQEEKRNAHQSEMKELQLGPFIGQHDLEIKLKRAREFITDGDKVKFSVRFKGREMGHTNLGRELLNKVVENMADIAKVEREIKMEGRKMVMTMSKGTTEKKESNEKVNMNNEQAEIAH